MTGKNSLPFPELTGDVKIPVVFKEDRVYTKADIHNSASEQMAHLLDEGEVDSLKLFAKLKAINEFINACIDNVKIDALSELDKFADGDECVVHGMKVVQKGTPKKYSYDHYDEWKQLKAKAVQAAEDLKVLEKKMKLCVGTNGVVDDSGEILPPAVVTDHGKTTIQVTIPNE